MGSPTTCDQLGRQQDRRIEYGRAVAARTRIATTIVELTSARSEIAVTAGVSHPATVAIGEALLSARIAHARIEVVIRTLARIP